MHPAHLIRLNFLFIFSGCTSQRPHIGPTSALGHCGSRTFWEYDSGLAYFPVHVVIFFHPTLINSKNSKTFLFTPQPIYSFLRQRTPEFQVYYRDAAAAFVVFDLSRIATFEAAAKWKDDLDMKVEHLFHLSQLANYILISCFFLFLRGQLNRFQLCRIQNGQQTISFSDFVTGSNRRRDSSASNSSR